VTILIKAATGLVAGVVAGGLGLVCLPRPAPNALKPRAAVEKPQFVAAAPSTKSAAPATIRATPAVAVAAETQDRAKVAVAPSAKPSPTPVAAAAPAPQVKSAPPAPIAVAQLEPTKPAPSQTPAYRTVTFAQTAPAAAPAATLAPAPAEVAVPRAPQPSSVASDASASWSVRGLIALARGDLSSARVYLTRAAEAGDPRALVALADTYDPAMLAKLGVIGAPGDAQRAKDFLAKAAAAGVVAVRDRTAALDQTAH